MVEGKEAWRKAEASLREGHTEPHAGNPHTSTTNLQQEHGSHRFAGRAEHLVEQRGMVSASREAIEDEALRAVIALGR